MAIRLPLDDRAGLPGFSFSIALEGDVFGLTFRYNDRDQRYYLDVADEDGAILAASRKVVLNEPLLNTVVDVRRPKGDFFAIDVGAQAEPTLGTLGAGVDVVFVSYLE